MQVDLQTTVTDIHFVTKKFNSYAELNFPVLALINDSLIYKFIVCITVFTETVL